MNLTITYVHHNCFLVDDGLRVLLFDYPAEAHRHPEAESVVRRALAGREAVAFFSHSHSDHCSADVLGPLAEAGRAHLVLSDDVPDMIPALDLPGAAVLEPGDDPRGGDPGPAASVGGLVVRAIESNDLGAAFLVDAGDYRLYYGGDLAEWLWPGQDAASQEQVRAFFGRSIETVRAFGPDAAFTDCDARLPGRGGFERFAREVRPRFLVPTHDFGIPGLVMDYTAKLDLPGTRVMSYAACGDAEHFDLEPPATGR